MKKIISLILCLLMLLSSVCTTAFAKDMSMAGHWVTVSANMEGTVLTQEELEAYGMSMWIDLNEDGTAVMFMEGEQMDGINWSVADNMLVLTLGGDSMMIEILEDGTLNMEGIIFALNGIAGTWNAISAEVDGETMDKAMLEMFGLLITLNFNEDGTGTLAMEGEAGDITWTENAGVVSIFVEGDSTTLNMNDDGTLSGDFGGVIIAFAKVDGEVAVGGETPVEVPADVDTSALLGTWSDGDATNFTIYADGTCVATDQYGDSWMDWEVVDGVPMITTGMWSSAPLVLNADGTLYVNDGMIVEKTFTFGAGEIHVGSTLAEPTGTIAASSAEEFFGEWKGETMVMESGTFALADMMMVMDLTINADGTLTLFDGAETDTAPWTFADGYITAADGMVELSLMENGQLCMAQEFNILYLSRAEGGEAAMNTPVATTDNVPAASAAAFVGTWVNDYYKLELYEDGTGKYFYPDGTYDDKVWVANDAGIQFTDLWWNGSTAVIDADGSLNVDNGWYVFKSENGSAAAPEASAEVPAEAMILIGEWLKPDNGNVLNINTDGTMVLTYPSGTVYDMTWAIENGEVVVTTGLWEYYPMTVNEEDILEIGMFEYERVGEPYAAPVEAPVADADTEAYLGDWVEALTSISMTVNADGTVKVTYPDGGGLDMTWELIDGALEFTSGNWWGSRAVIEADGSLNIDDGWTVMTRADSSAPVETPVDTSAEGVVPVAAEAEDFAGRWIGQTMEMEGQTIALKDMGMTMEIEFGLYGNISLFDGEYTETGLWTLVDGKADIDGMVCTLMSDGTLVAEDPEGAKVIFTGFIGTWKACYMSTGGLTGDLRSMGITSTLVLNADGTGSIDFPTPEEGIWYREEGILRFGENGMPMTVLPGGFLKFGSDLAGYLVFSKDENSTWDPSMEVVQPVATPEPVATAEPAQAPASGDEGDMMARMNKKYVAKTYTSFGQTMDASMLGAEYSMLFHENGTCDFGLAGMVVPNLPWGLQKVATGLTEVDAFVINYYGTMFNAVLTAEGFDMDYYGTMTLHFVPAE